jgi:hypothetical protein
MNIPITKIISKTETFIFIRLLKVLAISDDIRTVLYESVVHPNTVQLITKTDWIMIQRALIFVYATRSDHLATFARHLHGQIIDAMATMRQQA